MGELKIRISEITFEEPMAKVTFECRDTSSEYHQCFEADVIYSVQDYKFDHTLKLAHEILADQLQQIVAELRQIVQDWSS